ncbi:MAG: hypothetical protein NT077_01840 [Candidatus Taylorbacteria bacterium]|nr:hypothetical protein [Candidatus Taylorbacteria bacterium]
MRNYKHNKNGYILITIAVLFAALGLVLVLGGAVPVVSHYSSIQGYAYSKQALLASNSGINEAIYRLKTGKNLPISMVVSLNTGSSTITTTATPGGKQVAVEGVQKSYERNFQASLQYANGIAFNYGLQAGVGGMTMGGGSTINGNVYSNGDVDAISATINGSAVAADGSQMTIDQVNNTPSTPTNSIKFRDISSVRDFAQSFQPATSSVLNKISIYIKKVGTPPDGTIRLVTDNGGSPSTTQIPIGTLPLDVSMITANYSWVDLAFPTPPTPTPGTTYWLVLDNGSQSSSNYFVVSANNS